ncbi:hypothetical protein PtB15_6B897 [Puccinia triticina]|nr:hypothetical protein PtB15_6B897 [Puccinia triticina]
MWLKKQTTETSVALKYGWMLKYLESTPNHLAALDNEEQSVPWQTHLAQKVTNRDSQNAKSPPLVKREFFGNDVEQGVITLRSQHYNRPSAELNDPNIPPLVILPAESLTSPSGSAIKGQADFNFENELLAKFLGDVNLSTEKQTTGNPESVSDGSTSKISTPTTLGSQLLPPSIRNKGSSDSPSIKSPTPENQRSVATDLKEFDAQGSRSLPQDSGSTSKNQNDSTKIIPQPWLIGTSCVLLVAAIILCIALKKRLYQVSFKPFKIHKAPKSAGSGKSGKSGQKPKISQPSRPYSSPQIANSPTEERLISPCNQNRETFGSIVAELNPNPALSVKRNPQSSSNRGIIDRLRRLFRFQDAKGTKSTSSSTQASISRPDAEKLDNSQPPLPEIYLSHPDPVHQKSNTPSDYHKLMDGTQQENHGLSVSAMSPLKSSPIIQFNEIHPETQKSNIVLSFNQIGKQVPNFANACVIANLIEEKKLGFDKFKFIHNKWISALSYEATVVDVYNMDNLKLAL